MRFKFSHFFLWVGSSFFSQYFPIAPRCCVTAFRARRFARALWGQRQPSSAPSGLFVFLARLGRFLLKACVLCPRLQTAVGPFPPSEAPLVATFLSLRFGDTLSPPSRSLLASKVRYELTSPALGIGMRRFL